ncbi:ABC transporter permease [Bifidobacterium sp. AGR2158]|uniref:ABC transporter permease n=1 Tax=Bifidobacterium sp. AGR2158 TaxID=1280675 RepID=UPI0003FC07BB|nr:ABC transporter permease [Bifidobacterium sp. AGR2158]
MRTFKATLKILLAQRLMILIYVVWLCLMMFGLSWSLISDLSKMDNSTTFDSARPEVAVVNRDAHGAGLDEPMRAFLERDCDLVDVGTTDEQLQTAAASNYVDLIVIIPDGYTDRLADAIGRDARMPQLDVVVSFTGAYGSLARLQVDEFLRLTRTAALAAAHDASVSAAALADAADRVVDTLADASDAYPRIAVADDPGAAGDRQEAARTAYVQTVKMGVYPLLAAMLVCTALTMNAFAGANVRRRLYASPQRTGTMVIQEFAGCALFGIVVSLLYWGISLALPALAGLPIDGIPLPTILYSGVSLALYALVSVASGFMIGMLSVNAVAINAIANVYGLLVMFTSGMAFPIDMMPKVMITIGKLLPGWWFCQSIDAVDGVDGRVDLGGWLSCNGLVLLFGVAFICLGLAFSKGRRSHPVLAAPGTTQLAEV